MPARQGLCRVAVFDRRGDGTFPGKPVLHIDTHQEVDFDLLLVVSLEHPGPIIDDLVLIGINRDRLATLR